MFRISLTKNMDGIEETFDGKCVYLPVQGKRFVAILPRSSGQRVLETTPLESVQFSGNSVDFSTLNSSYHMVIKEEYDVVSDVLNALYGEQLEQSEIDPIIEAHTGL